LHFARSTSADQRSAVSTVVASCNKPSSKPYRLCRDQRQTNEMGKKSRRAKGAAADVSRKERLQERRERLLHPAHPDQPYENDIEDDSDERGNNARRYFQGDRVWFYSEGNSDGNNPNTYRGVVSECIDTLVGIISLQSKMDGTDEVWSVDIQDVFPDFCDVTLRFNVGDRVLCHYENGWGEKERCFALECCLIHTRMVSQDACL